MGQTKWRPEELTFLRTEFSSADAHDILRERPKGSLHRVASMISTKYFLRFSVLFIEETEAELHLRRAAIKTSKHRRALHLFPAESAEECKA